MWIHNECSFITETQHETVSNTNCTWICPKCEFFNFSDSFFGEQVNLETENRFVPLTKEKKDRSSPCGTNKSSFISGLKFISMNINSIRGKKLELLAFLDFNQPHVVAIQETKIDSSIATSQLFPETCPYSVYRKDRNIHGGGVMLLVHKDISHMPITELENDSESIWVKVFANKTSHFVASWYRPLGSTSEEFQLFSEQLDYIRTHHKGKKLPSVHVLGDFNFKDVDWPDRLFCLLLGPPGFNCWFSSAPVFQWCCSTPQGSPSVGRNTFLSSPHLCFIIVFICDLFVSRDDPLMS